MDHIILNDEVEPIEVVAAPDDDEMQYPEFVDKWDMLEFEDYDGDIVTGAQFEEADEEEEEENIAMGVDEQRVMMYREIIMTEIIHP
jgi:hypothetical protein